MTPWCPLTSGATSTSQGRGFGMSGQSLTGRRQYPLPSRRFWWIHFSPLSFPDLSGLPRRSVAQSQAGPLT
jgi:hypothetical protein